MFKTYLKRMMLLAAEGGGAGGTGGTGTGDAGSGAGGTGGETLTFETWHATQPDNVKGLLDGHVNGLKSALNSERESRKDLEKQLRELAGKVEKGSDAQTQLTGMADKLLTADQRADFYEEAHKQGVSNLKLAYLTATADGLIDNKGRVNFDKLKTDYPELFSKKPVTKGNAGNGTNDDAPKGGGMNQFIRTAAGRGS